MGVFSIFAGVFKPSCLDFLNNCGLASLQNVFSSTSSFSSNANCHQILAAFSIYSSLRCTNFYHYCSFYTSIDTNASSINFSVYFFLFFSCLIYLRWRHLFSIRPRAGPNLRTNPSRHILQGDEL